MAIVSPVGFKIKYLGHDSTAFEQKKLDETPFEHKQEEYHNDPLMKMPVRLAAYSNEVGIALKPVIGAAASNAMWIPSLMYIGAYVFGPKVYGEDKDNLNLAKRGVFQALTSVILPTAIAELGKKGAEIIMKQKLGKDVVEKALKEGAKMNKLKALKSLGGFAALGLLIKPIDLAVENIVVKKIVEPLYEKFAAEKQDKLIA